MIHEVAGDILLTKAQAVAHGVAPNDHFDSGLALALREQWPAPVESLTVVDGALDGIDRAFSSLLRFGDRAVIENPTFPPVLDLLEHYGVEPIGVELDREGMLPSAFSSPRPSASDAKARATRPATVMVPCATTETLVPRRRWARNCTSGSASSG